MINKALSIVLILIVILAPFVSFGVLSDSACAAGITLDPESGVVGAFVSVHGVGFAGDSATIYWDDEIAAKGVPVSEHGEILFDLRVPDTCKGSHIVQVIDNSHWSGGSASIAFTVLPRVSIFPDVGRVGTATTIVGTGFVASERNIRVTWNGSVVGSPITANQDGTWSVRFDIPDVAKGEHLVGAYGESTDSAEIAGATFAVAPMIKVKPSQGPVGTEIVVSGLGFRTGEDGITLTYDDEMFKCNIVAEGDGSWSDTVSIPHSAQGYHSVGAYGSSFTHKGVVPSVDFEVTPQIRLEPDSGIIGAEVVAIGTGFGVSETIVLSFDDVELDIEDIVTDAVGTFNASFDVPRSRSEEPLVAVVGSFGNLDQAIFSMEAMPPQSPQLLSPVQGAKLEIFESVGDVVFGTFRYLAGVIAYIGGGKPDVFNLASGIFRWADVVGADDAVYILQIAATNDFTSPVLSKKALVDPEYVLSGEDTLTPGSYSWRVKVVDDAGNEGQWSEVWEFEVVSMTTKVLGLSVAVVVAVVALIVGLVIFLRVRKSYL